MSEPRPQNLSSLWKGAPDTATQDAVAASPHQLARLRYLGVAVQEPLSSFDANRIIDHTNNDPAYTERIQAWEDSKQALHPDLFRVPTGFAGFSAPAVPSSGGSSIYAPISEPAAPAFRPSGSTAPVRSGSSPAKAILIAATLAVLVILGGAGWFLWKSPWLLRMLHVPAIVGVSTGSTNSAPAAIPGSPERAGSLSGNRVAAPPTAEFAARVAESQRLAVARYPSLGSANSEMNSRFVFRYKRMLTDHSARLQDSSWPLQLADECAAASGLKPAGSATKKSVTSARSR